MSKMIEKLYTISEVADKLSLSTKTLRRWEETGKFIGTRTLGGQRRYTMTDLQILDAIKHGIIPDSHDLLTIEQAAAMFGVSVPTIVRWEDEGKIHPLITVGVTYYPRHRLLAKLSELTKPDINTVYPLFQPVDIPTPPPVMPSYPAIPQPAYHPPEEPIRPAPVLITNSMPLTQPRPRLTPHISLPHIPQTDVVVSLNVAITIVLLLTYHLLFNRRPTPTNQGSVQGVETQRDATLTLLDSLFDASGNLRLTSLTTPKLNLAASSAPLKPTPGTIYFDTGSQALKIYLNGAWRDLNPGAVASPSLKSSQGMVSRGAAAADIQDASVTSSSHISVTMTSDYSPAKKYWVTKNNKSFTVTFDAPVAAVVTFDYSVDNTMAPSPTPTPSVNQTSGTTLKDIGVR